MRWNELPLLDLNQKFLIQSQGDRRGPACALPASTVRNGAKSSRNPSDFLHDAAPSRRAAP